MGRFFGLVTQTNGDNSVQVHCLQKAITPLRSTLEKRSEEKHLKKI